MPYSDPNIARTHASWRGMILRCSPRASNDHRKHYYEKHITVCDRWSNFRVFLEDMGFRPVGMVLDRIHNDCGYGPGNCRWATKKLSTENRTITVWLTIGEQTKRVSEWSVISGTREDRIYCRLSRGWSHEDAVFCPRLNAGKKASTTP